MCYGFGVVAPERSDPSSCSRRLVQFDFDIADNEMLNVDQNPVPVRIEVAPGIYQVLM